MITNLHIENFRSIEKASVDLGRITALTGANNSGKTSIMHALMTMRNIYTNPNRTADEFLVINNVNLGGFKEVVFRKDESRKIKVGLSFGGVFSQKDFVTFNETKITFTGKNISFKLQNSENLSITSSLPCNLSKMIELKKVSSDEEYTWNGLFYKNKLSTKLSGNTFHHLRRTSALGSYRTFTKPFYAQVPVQQLVTEDELATLLSLDRDLESKVARYLRKITGNLMLSVRPIPGITSFQLQVQDIESPASPLTDLVNEGLGIHHLVVILIKALRKETKVLCIDEPELHLHPSMIHRLVEALAEIAVEEDKQFIVATHSEHFLSAMLNCVIKKQLKPDEAAIHYVHKHQGITQVDRQDVNAKGQLKGGMRTFYEAELSQLDTLLAAED